MSFRQRLGIGHVKCGAAQLTCAKCGIECQAINEIAATDVHQRSAWLAQRQAACVEIASGGIVVGDSADNDISLGNELFCLLKRAEFVEVRALCLSRTAYANDVRIEARKALCAMASNVSRTEDKHGCAFERFDSSQVMPLFACLMLRVTPQVLAN